MTFPSIRPLFALCLVLAFAAVATAAETENGLVHRWEFTAEYVQGDTAKPLAGDLTCQIVAPIKFLAEPPKSLVLAGDLKGKQYFEAAADLTKAGLPSAAITAAAWVRIDRAQDWGGIVGALQDNGSYEKGWMLGYRGSQFFFAVAGKEGKSLTYLVSKTDYQTGAWYYVVGTYDGAIQRLYIDGRLAAESKAQRGPIDYPPKGSYTLAAYRDDDELFPLAGSLAEASVYSRALAPEEIAAQFAKRKADFPGSDGTVFQNNVVDWPMDQHDSRRRGITERELKLPLTLRWEHNCRLPPAPAWPEEAKNDYFNNKYNMADRVVFDCAFHVVGVGEHIYYGSSAENYVAAIDLKTGEESWRFLSGGPVRLAPTVVGERLYFGSDDGCAYCVDAKNGDLVWKRRLGPSDRQVAGNQRIISLWPVRTDVLVENGKAYTCAGVFPSQGVYQYELNPDDGEILAEKPLKTTAQGYLAIKFGTLLVGQGRNPSNSLLARLPGPEKEIAPASEAPPKEYPLTAIGAGSLRFSGGAGKLAAFKAATGERVWTADVKGDVYSLAVVGDNLLASTNQGVIYCFSNGAGEPRRVTPAPPHNPAFDDEPAQRRFAAAADFVVKQAPFARGYCLVLDDASGHLAIELALRSEWQIVAHTNSAAAATAVRKRVIEAGLCGRVAVHEGAADKLPYSGRLFNVVVHEGLATGATLACPPEEALRVTRPHGGITIFGLDEKLVTRQGPLAGEGEWTHLYANPANTSCSGDSLVTGELAMQWFGKPGPHDMVDRHHRTVAPLYKAGRLFVPGENRVTGIDSFNGTILWEREFPGTIRVTAFRDSSYLALADDALYIAAPSETLALDPQTGRTLRTFALPPGEHGGEYEWAYLAVEGNTLFGSAAKLGSIRRQQNHQATVTTTHWDNVPAVGSDYLFAFDRTTGKLLWRYEAPAGLIVNQSLTLGGGNLLFLESDNGATMKAKLAQAKLADLFSGGAKLTALNTNTGKPAWRRDCPQVAHLEHNVFGSYANDVFLLVGSRNSIAGEPARRLFYEVSAFGATSGEPLWSKTQDQNFRSGGDHGEQDRHPAIVGDKVYCEPYSYDLATGKPLEWKWPWAASQRRGCGTISASSASLFFRSENAQSFDLDAGAVKPVTSETRPGCWINLIPAGGMLLAPEASSGCSCNFAVQCSLGMVPKAAPAK